MLVLEHKCLRCDKEVVSPVRVWTCADCGGHLAVYNARPEVTEEELADVFAGFDKLLSEAS